ncbi:MAG: hypothetical protein LQ344_002542 [Seirophora lacunosa]|nr:MAG: hypothetical protein LQ344_002542 [Seirophora lacunosa]
MSKQEYWDDQRVGFDDSETLAGKTNCAAEKCFGGTMIWSLDMDSSHGSGNIPNPRKPGSGTVSDQPSPNPILPVLVAAAPGKWITDTKASISLYGAPDR